MDRGGTGSLAVSPVLGVILMVALTVLLAPVIVVAFPEVEGLEANYDRTHEYWEDQAEDMVGNVKTTVWVPNNESGVGLQDKENLMAFKVSEDSDTAGNSLNSIEITYPSGFDASDVDSRSDIVQVGLDQDGDGKIDSGRDATDDVECCPPDDGVKISNDGKTLTIETSGNYDVKGGDNIIAKYKGVDSGAPDGNVTVGINGDVTKTMPMKQWGENEEIPTPIDVHPGGD